MKNIPQITRNSFLTYLKHCSIFVCLLIFSLWSNADAASTIKIGEINPLTGRFAKQGLETHQGVATAVAEANDAGGIDGRVLELISRDDQSLPDVAISRAEELCGKKNVVALTGGYVDSLVGPVSEVARKYKTPYLASASLQKELVMNENPYFFRVSRLQGFVDPLCGVIVERFQPERLAIVHASTPGSTELARDLEECLNSRGTSVVLIEKFRPGTPDFTPLIGKLSSLNVDVIVSGGFTPDHMLLVRQLKENRVSPKAYIGPFGIAYESFIQAMGDDAEYLFSTSAWTPDITLPGTEKTSAEFVRRFRKMFNRQPNTTNMHGYTSTRALVTAMREVLKRRKSLTGENIRRMLSEIDLTLPMEQLAFDHQADPKHYRHVVVQIQKGNIKAIYPPERANASAIYPMPSWNQR
ncbi:ABC transporter substrate-binding protein [Thermodesulfobacteriota bacterium]